MLSYTVHRVVWMVPVLLVVGLITFVIMHAAPGDPFPADPLRRQMSAATEEMRKKDFGLDRSLPHQFVAYMVGETKWHVEPTGQLENSFVCGVICLNFGRTFTSRGTQTVQAVLFSPMGRHQPSRFYYTARLAVQALTLALILGIPLGILGALKQNTWVDYVILVGSTLFVAVPVLVIGLFLIIIFSSTLNWVPVIPRDWTTSMRPWILPTISLGLGSMALVIRLTRSAILEAMLQEYVRTARAKGLSEWVVIMRHVLRNALIPVVTVIFPALAALLTGGFFTESIFSVPGMGRELVRAIGNRDYPMIMGASLFYAFLIAMANLLVDLAYRWLDPRIRLS